MNESCRNVLSSRRSFENKDALFGIIKVDEDTSVLARLGELQKAILVDTLHLFLKINELRTKQTNKGKAPTEQASSTSTPASGPSGETSSAKGVEGGKASVAAETDAEVWKRRMTMSNAEEFGKLVKSTGDYLTSLFDGQSHKQACHSHRRKTHLCSWFPYQSSQRCSLGRQPGRTK